MLERLTLVGDPPERSEEVQPREQEAEYLERLVASINFRSIVEDVGGERVGFSAGRYRPYDGSAHPERNSVVRPTPSRADPVAPVPQPIFVPARVGLLLGGGAFSRPERPEKPER